MDIVSQHAHNQELRTNLFIYSCASIAGLVVGLIFMPYFLLLNFNIVFFSLSLLSFVFGFFSGVYLEMLVRRKVR